MCHKSRKSVSESQIGSFGMYVGMKSKKHKYYQHTNNNHAAEKNSQNKGQNRGHGAQFTQ